MAYEDNNAARRRATANARRQSSYAQPTRVSGKATEARRAAAMDLEHSSATRRDERYDYGSVERGSVLRATEGDISTSVGNYPNLHIAHRAERSAMSTPIPRGQQFVTEGYELSVDAAEQDAPAPRRMPQAQPYVHKERPRRTQEAIDDLEADEVYSQSAFVHDSSLRVSKGNPFSATGRAYRRSSKQLPQLHSDKGYGRYLSVPKGNGSLFRQEHSRRRRQSIMLTAAAIIAAVLVLIFIWRFFF